MLAVSAAASSKNSSHSFRSRLEVERLGVRRKIVFALRRRRKSAFKRLDVARYLARFDGRIRVR